MIIMGVGNTSICAWTKIENTLHFEQSSSGKSDFGSIYDDTVNHVKVALKMINKPTLDLVLWHQGEADFNESHKYYEQRLNNLIQQYRSETFGNERLAFICGQVLHVNDDWHFNTQNEVLNRVHQMNRYVRCADTGNLPNLPYDPIHFSSEGHRLMGKKYFESFVDICQNSTPPEEKE